MRLQHVGLIVSDLERSRRFYGEALGLEEVQRPANFTFAGAWFRFGGSEIHLLSEADADRPSGAAASRGRRGARDDAPSRFAVDDLDAARAPSSTESCSRAARCRAATATAGLLPGSGRSRPRAVRADARGSARRPGARARPELNPHAKRPPRVGAAVSVRVEDWIQCRDTTAIVSSASWPSRGRLPAGDRRRSSIRAESDPDLRYPIPIVELDRR